ncbi:hypothetical protein PUR71_23955 [Streptomyces sp. SP17BM10]|uniref:hypothetical protein n=1 Tax=Streptomyces sp. SP17BM10 TaxID=3002530 RepID=UPI002E78FA72|nr:hypothetical protein [Streptomyces sp. SP17BM10]MEE1785929.1 hypothetical protein [Streptomyces sp. SP17BM10]
MPSSIARPAALAVAGLIIILPLSAVSCSAAQKALDCGTTAARVTTDIADVTSAYGSTSNDSAAAQSKALQKLRTDLDQIGKNSKNTDVVKAVNDLRTQADKVQQAADRKEAPDLKPLADAAGNLTSVCTG